MQYGITISSLTYSHITRGMHVYISALSQVNFFTVFFHEKTWSNKNGLTKTKPKKETVFAAAN